MKAKPPRRPKTTAFYSHEPWLGFSAHDSPRARPLALCPAARCRRAKTCIAAHEGLYCRRTHFAPAEDRHPSERAALQKRLDRYPPVDDPDDLEGRILRAGFISDIRRDHKKKLTARWKAGAFDRLYGKYSPHGKLMQPPPRIYVEEGAERSVHRASKKG